MGDIDKTLVIGAVKIQVVLGDIRVLEADAVVEPAGTSQVFAPGLAMAPWVLSADEPDNTIRKALEVHAPLELGKVIITPAGHVKSKYLFNAVVIDWGRKNPSDALLSDQVVVSTARKCIEIAAALGLRSIAFTPWGTRIEAADPARVTALLVQAIAAALRDGPGSLETVYLITTNPDHYKLFLDRTFVFGIMLTQVEQIRSEIHNLGLPDPAVRQLDALLGNLKSNISTVNIFNDNAQLTTGGVRMTESTVDFKGNVVGGDSSVGGDQTFGDMQKGS